MGFEGKGVRSLFHEAIRAIADELDFRVRKCDNGRVRSYGWKIKGAIDRLSIRYSNCLPLTAFQPF
jgi:hypothetical protein